MNARELLCLLEGVRPTGEDRWISRCPSHPDRRPSLSIRQLPGRILLKCHAGCENDEIVRAVNLEMADLFDRSYSDRGCAAVRASPTPWKDALICLGDDAVMLIIFASEMARGEQLSDEDRDKLATIVGRFFSAIEACRGAS